jgi:GMP synthase-like glutamine amidotransferase
VRALAIIHQRDAGAGVFAEAIATSGWELAEWRIAENARPPGDQLEFDAVLSFGGAMHVDQQREHPWIEAEKRVLAELLERGRPLLGVCLGAQLLAAGAGADVERLPEPEIGWYPVATVSGSADPLIGPLPREFEALGWHSYAFGEVPGSSRLATSANCQQAFRIGDAAWGIQFHAEVTAADFEHWLDDYSSDPDAVAIGLEPEPLRATTRGRIATWNELGRDLCRRFLSAATPG